MYFTDPADFTKKCGKYLLWCHIFLTLACSTTLPVPVQRFTQTQNWTHSGKMSSCQSGFFSYLLIGWWMMELILNVMWFHVSVKFSQKWWVIRSKWTTETQPARWTHREHAPNDWMRLNLHSHTLSIQITAFNKWIIFLCQITHTHIYKYMYMYLHIHIYMYIYAYLCIYKYLHKLTNQTTNQLTNQLTN